MTTRMEPKSANPQIQDNPLDFPFPPPDSVCHIVADILDYLDYLDQSTIAATYDHLNSGLSWICLDFDPNNPGNPGFAELSWSAVISRASLRVVVALAPRRAGCREMYVPDTFTAGPRLPPNATFGGMATYAREMLTSPRDCHGGGATRNCRPLAIYATRPIPCALFSRGDRGDFRPIPVPPCEAGSDQLRRGARCLGPRSRRKNQI
jgi:hypothetical protein